MKRRRRLGAMLGTDDDLRALWDVYDATGIRPEYALVALYHESGLDPSVPNRAGAPYYGINQASGTFLQSLGISPSDFLTWSAAQQLRQVVAKQWAGMVSQVGVPRSGARTLQMNFLPATLKTAPSQVSVVTWRGHPSYEYNSDLDFLGKGVITVADLVYAAAKSARSTPVKWAIANAYALAPGESPRDPVYGEDLVDPLRPIAAGGAAALLAALL